MSQENLHSSARLLFGSFYNLFILASAILYFKATRVNNQIRNSSKPCSTGWQTSDAQCASGNRKIWVEVEILSLASTVPLSNYQVLGASFQSRVCIQSLGQAWSCLVFSSCSATRNTRHACGIENCHTFAESNSFNFFHNSKNTL